MKILLDENIPAKIKFDFGSDFEVKTVKDMNWQGTKNGKLLALINENQFDFFITLDRNLRYQQNLSQYGFAIILLLSKNNKHQTLQPFVSKIQKLITAELYPKFNEITSS